VVAVSFRVKRLASPIWPTSYSAAHVVTRPDMSCIRM
jgi:hypothetical protein